MDEFLEDLDTAGFEDWNGDKSKCAHCGDLLEEPESVYLEDEKAVVCIECAGK